MISWNEVKTKGFSSNTNYFKIAAGESVEIRPIGLPCYMKKYMIQHEGKWRSAICLDEGSCPIALNHNCKPQERCAINVINRKTKRIEIFENSIKIFKQMKIFYDKTGKNPGAADGARFNIRLSQGSQSFKTYELEFLGSHILDDNDIALINSQGLYKLKNIYKATDPSKIEEVLFGISSSKNDDSSKVVKFSNLL